MKQIQIILFFTLISASGLRAQDTFSILAFDSITREVGAAGASCVDLMGSSLTDDFICELFPDTGAMASQASYIPQNQINGRGRMRAGDSPAQLLTWLQLNDVSSNPNIRQYGVVNMNTGISRTAAFTGSNCINYKNHRVGPNYTIHGNILLGAEVLDSMEARFLRTEGDLACKLMSAMQGAKMIGADTRCASNQSSSLFAFLKVSLPTDTFGKPSFIVSVRTAYAAEIEPIDSLQKMFDAVKTCTTEVIDLTGLLKNQNLKSFEVFPNPSQERTLLVKSGVQEPVTLSVFSASGSLIYKENFTGNTAVKTQNWSAGVYIFELRQGGKALNKKIVLE